MATIVATKHPSGCYSIGDRYPIIIVNASDRAYTDHRYVLAFGAYGWTRVLVYANHLDDALDEAIDWLADHAPGLLCDDEVSAEYDRLVASGVEPDMAVAAAEVDTTLGGNAGHYLHSWEWSIVAEDPTRAQLAAMLD